MPTGKPVKRRAAGFTYLLLLFWLALTGAGLAAAGTAWSTAAQRGREAELRFRGEQFAAALASYRQATPSGQADAPLALDELLEDRRSVGTRRHLRRLWPDPYTGAADWVLLRQQGRITAVRSRSQAAVFHAPPQGSAASQAVAADWVFGGGAVRGDSAVAINANGTRPPAAPRPPSSASPALPAVTAPTP